MKFTFEEAELINNFFELENMNERLNKEKIVYKLEQAKASTEEPELIAIANNTIQKLKQLDDDKINNIFKNLPIDIYKNY